MGTKFFVVVGVLNVVFFFALAGSVYETRWENIKLKEKISDNEERISYLQYEVDRNFEVLEKEISRLNKRTFVRFKHLHNKTDKLKIKISILDESIDPENKRWALIKRVRSVVEKYAVPKMNITDYTYVAGAVVDFSEAHDVSIPLVLAVMKRESAFNPRAKSHAGAEGIMQIMPSTAVDIAAEIGKRQYNLYNSKHNIQLGTYYLWKMNNRFHDIELAVRAYNCGPTCVDKVTAGSWSGYPEETVHYHEAVMKYKKEFEEMGL